MESNSIIYIFSIPSFLYLTLTLKASSVPLLIGNFDMNGSSKVPSSFLGVNSKAISSSLLSKYDLGLSTRELPSTLKISHIPDEYSSPNHIGVSLISYAQ